MLVIYKKLETSQVTFTCSKSTIEALGKRCEICYMRVIGDLNKNLTSKLS